ncbi:Carbon monoxide dehydrogenase subunit G (fragment) [Nostocoides australiense Ben110]|uniref:Carbon monoxide dehydrogenase subunit G n=2 Tax=Intrasporangiaceae TaxID=85021 RepID=W6K0X4_9MICO
MIGGVGQRMLTGVTKKMAGEFFKAVDADIAGVRPAEPAAVGAPAERAGELVGAAAGPVSYAGRPAAAAGGGGIGLGENGFALGVAVGGLVALAGVALGAAVRGLGR